MIKDEIKVKSDITPVEKKEEQAPTVLVTHTDAYIHERIKSQPKSIEDLSVEVGEQNPNRHRLSLPDELKPYEKKFSFRWIFKNKRAIDEACDVRGWVLANRMYFPDLPKFLFAMSGCIERGDNILSFMPKERAEKLRKEPGEKSRAVLQATFSKHKDNPNYYVPKDDDDEHVIGI